MEEHGMKDPVTTLIILKNLHLTKYFVIPPHNNLVEIYIRYIEKIMV